VLQAGKKYCDKILCSLECKIFLKCFNFIKSFILVSVITIIRTKAFLLPLCLGKKLKNLYLGITVLTRKSIFNSAKDIFWYEVGEKNTYKRCAHLI